MPVRTKVQLKYAFASVNCIIGSERRVDSDNLARAFAGREKTRFLEMLFLGYNSLCATKDVLPQ